MGESLRTSAFVAISTATTAVTICLLSFPLLFHYVQRVESAAQAEIDWCYTRSRTMWQDIVSVRQFKPSMSSFLNANMEARHRGARSSAGAAFFASRHGVATNTRVLADEPLDRQDRAVFAFQTQDSCCTCQRGPPGPPGAPGLDGRDGISGDAGSIGAPGDAVPLSDEFLPKFADQCPCEADKGAPGEVGPRGNPGNPGTPGQQGPPGDQGRPGGQGDAGLNGRVGEAGRPGLPGVNGALRESDVRGPPGPGGRPGSKGLPGENGQPGKAGSPGDNGAPGLPGDQGFPGDPGLPGNAGGSGEDGDEGPPGGCNQCPPPRLAPGY